MPTSRKPKKVRTTKSKAKSKSKSKAPVEPVVEQHEEKSVEVETTPVVATPVNLEENVKSDFLNLLEKVQCLTTLIREINTEVKVLQKKVSKEFKTLIKTQKKARKTGGTRAPSGFAKPTKISVELCKFLSVTPGTLMARTEVTKKLTQYIKEHSLQNEADKRIILPDKKLAKLLSVKKSDNVTYFNLQRWIKPHFIKST